MSVITVNGKRDINLKDSKEWYIGEFRGKEKWVNYVLYNLKNKSNLKR